MRAPRTRTAVRRTAVAGVFALAGLLFTTSALTSRGTDLRSDTADLGALVAERSRLNEQRAARVGDLRAEVAELTRTAAPAVAADPLDEPALGIASGALAATGPGVTVVLDDAPDTVRPAGASPDDLVVHQQDVEAVVNALWAGGAEAMSIMDQRVVSTSAVRCVGNVLVLQGRTYSPPYRVSAIGDPEALRAALGASAQVAVYRQYVDAYGLGWSVEAHDEADGLLLPAFDGSTALDAARVPA
ncbi:DUF881 domain-containing protein [Paenibacillus sp. TRM 82003]|uniref:DUF881 domain-containing protein n=1 Tax=Kineococcus sp. TRM81007 TaxID=2925831 RepID=UPI001F580A62|nr:DUF881 domain-containing protein [Kineococcus sp. TRM81007]MCI2240563.1 DUF881 domain-containing protein [Kineococcus sp. TRM81007]MCI3918942.1 DUF881 domain-containing protein [Paenibacillus sp. TRM 82003]